MVIKKLNREGIEELRNVYQALQNGSITQMPDKFFNSYDLAVPAKGNIEIEFKDYAKKEPLIKYLSNKTSSLEEEEVKYNVGLWSWLAAFYFDLLCPWKNGKRNVRSIDRHILNTEWRRYNRHLLACPVRLYKELGEIAKIYLIKKPDIHPDILEQLSANQEIATSKSIVKAATMLYWDDEKDAIKRGITTRRGNVVRFARVIPQFQMTYDLNTMSGKEIVDLLPDEFNQWIEE